MRPFESCKAFDFRPTAAEAAIEVDILLTGCESGARWEQRPAANRYLAIADIRDGRPLPPPRQGCVTSTVSKPMPSTSMPKLQLE